MQPQRLAHVAPESNELSGFDLMVGVITHHSMGTLYLFLADWQVRIFLVALHIDIVRARGALAMFRSCIFRVSN
jgi:hypothetical protein